MLYEVRFEYLLLLLEALRRFIYVTLRYRPIVLCDCDVFRRYFTTCARIDIRHRAGNVGLSVIRQTSKSVSLWDSLMEEFFNYVEH